MLGWLLLVLLLAAPTRAMATDAGPVLRLRPGVDRLDAWTLTSVHLDEAGKASPGSESALIAEAGDASRFHPHGGAHASFGSHRGTLWLRLPVRLEDAHPGDWWLSIDYPALDEVLLDAVCGGRRVFGARMGDHVPMAQRAGSGRSHVAALPLPPQQDCVLLLRVRTTSAMIVPLRLLRTEALQRDEARVEALQGAAIGFGLCLFVYTALRAALGRDRLHGWFALATVFTTLFLAAYHGLAGEHLWPGSDWLVQQAPPLMVLLILWSGVPLLEQSLRIRSASRRASLGLRLVGAAALAAALAQVAGVLDYRGATLAGTVLGPWPMLLALPTARLRARQGEGGARWIFGGWILYGLGVGTASALFTGRLPFNAWTDHAFQFGSICQMVAWTAVLHLHARRQEQQAQAVQREADRLETMAHTDPLTGLTNRRGLQRALGPALADARAGRLAAVYLMDLDGFKPVNDLHGHDAGDELLVQFAQRLRHDLRAGDLVARLGGDEFVVVATGLPGEALAEQLGHKLLQVCAQPFALSNAQVRVGVTIGYALAPLDGRDPAELLKLADKALYAGKLGGKRNLRRVGASQRGTAAAGA